MKSIPIIEKIHNRLAYINIRTYHLPEEFGKMVLKDASVLLPLFFHEDELSIIFTERTDNVPTHKGQISFPGGSVDETDEDFAAAAVRETFEEVGILPEHIKILGQLSSYPTPAGFRIYPFAGYISQFSQNISLCEVSKVLIIPVRHLADEKNMEIKNYSRGETEYPMPNFYYENHTIWGATGMILKEFLDEIKDLL